MLTYGAVPDSSHCLTQALSRKAQDQELFGFCPLARPSDLHSLLKLTGRQEIWWRYYSATASCMPVRYLPFHSCKGSEPKLAAGSMLYLGTTEKQDTVQNVHRVLWSQKGHFQSRHSTYLFCEVLGLPHTSPVPHHGELPQRSAGQK